MKTKKRDILLIGHAGNCPDLEYISGFRAVDSTVFLLTSEGSKHVVVPEMEAGRAAASGRDVTVWTPARLGLRKASRRKISRWASRLIQRVGAHAVHVDAFFPLGIARELEKKGVHVRISRDALFPERAVKTPEECRKLTESQQAAVIAMRTAVALIGGADIDEKGLLRRGREWVTSESLRGLINHALLDRQCMCNDTIVAGGAQAADPHQIGSGPLKAHEAIVIDIFPRHLVSGYWGDLTRTVVRGRATPRMRKMYAAVKAAHSAALDHLRPGVKCSTVHRKVVEEIDRRGFPRCMIAGKPAGFIHSTGHGVGLAVHEAPSLGMNESRLRKGHVVTVEPGLYYPGEGGIRIEDTVVITREGWRYLVPCEKKFEL